MAPQKETIMVLKVDLDCPRCYKKVKKLLCQFPRIRKIFGFFNKKSSAGIFNFVEIYSVIIKQTEIHDQVYNEKQNMVMIKVICCSPEKIRDKLCCKGGKSIESIEIVQPKKPPEKPANKPPPNPAPAPPPPPPADKPNQETPPPKPTPAPPPADSKPPEKIKKNGSKKNGSPTPDRPPEEAPPPIYSEPAKPDPPPQKSPEPVPVHQVNPANMCCSECYEGRTTGPCYQGYGYGCGYGYGVPPPPPPPAGGWGYYSYSDCCPPPSGGGDYGDYNCNKYKPGYCVTRYGNYISDENPTACVIM